LGLAGHGAARLLIGRRHSRDHVRVEGFASEWNDVTRLDKNGGRRAVLLNRNRT
jgi:hypothetical protein